MYELATCRGENYLLKQRMTDCEATVQCLKVMVTNVSDKQLEIISQMVELRKNVSVPPKIATMDASTSTFEDGVLDYMPSNFESDEWNATSQAARAFSPIVSSESGSEPEMDPPEVSEYNQGDDSMPSWTMLYTINEEVEPEDS
ncbi:hypothetical protein KR038_006752 [Drosophila bunnanda]|nr:hypothetical protein KR038_006752 [Drosophila bunnanda]